MRPHLLHHHHRSMHPHAPRVLLGIGMIAIFVIALMLVFADTAGAAPRPGHGLELGPLGAGRHTHGMLPGLGLGILDAAEKLNLQDDQVTRLREIRKNAPVSLVVLSVMHSCRKHLHIGDGVASTENRWLRQRASCKQPSFECLLSAFMHDARPVHSIAKHCLPCLGLIGK